MKPSHPGTWVRLRARATPLSNIIDKIRVVSGRWTGGQPSRGFDLAMDYPTWIDEALSLELPLLRDRGEGQHQEFMVSYPQNGYELSKEIPAFASSNPGTILIGVSDHGSVAGLEDVDTPEGRDRLCRRIEGVCSGTVRPGDHTCSEIREGRRCSRARNRGSARRSANLLQQEHPLCPASFELATGRAA